jgi:membrane-bound lytic murein transglycosylase B
MAHLSMIRRLPMLLAGLGLLLPIAAGTAAAEPSRSFADWRAGLRAEAIALGIPAAIFDRAFAGLEPNPRVLQLDDRQPEFTWTVWRYLDNAVTDGRVAEGRRHLQAHGRLLGAVEAEYGVPARYLVAFWGLETGYGSFMGDFDVVRALATLAYHDRRAEIFRPELLAALELAARGDVPLRRMEGSWAGAMGHTQFLPSTYLRHAVDADGDGRRDLWNSLPDVFASSANYLRAIGWRAEERWGRQVRVPEGFPWELAELSEVRPLADWRRLGVTRPDGRPLPQGDMDASLILPMGHRGPAFLVYHNFRVILDWNRSIYYALAVGHLADRLAGAPPLTGPRPALGPALTTEEVRELQRLLAASGFDPGEPDGRTGPLTRGALRAFQASEGLPADGYPTRRLLALLRERAAARAP